MPTLKQLNKVLTDEPGVATKWYKLGVELLDSNTSVLDVIETNYQSDDDRCSRMFKKWLEMKPDASWSQLVAALNDIGLKSAANSVQSAKMSNEGQPFALIEFGFLTLSIVLYTQITFLGLCTLCTLS